MPLFGNRRTPPVINPMAGVPNLGPPVAVQGWQPIAGDPLTPGLTDAVHDITQAMYGAPRWTDRAPEEAIARFESLDEQRKMQLLAMFMRATGNT